MSNIIYIENTKFIYNTNFSGDPKQDKYGSSDRKGNLIIPDLEMAREMIDNGYNVKMTKPKEGEEEGYIPTYYITVKLAYRNRYGELKQWPPKVILVTENNTVELVEDTVKCIDKMWVDHVNVVLNTYESERGKSLWIKTMEVFQKVNSDPILARRAKERNNKSDVGDISFNSISSEYDTF